MYNTNDKLHKNEQTDKLHRNQNENENQNEYENQNQNELNWANHFIIYMLAREPLGSRTGSSHLIGRENGSSLLIGWRDLIYRHDWPFL